MQQLISEILFLGQRFNKKSIIDIPWDHHYYGGFRIIVCSYRSPCIFLADRQPGVDTPHRCSSRFFSGNSEGIRKDGTRPIAA